MRFVMTDLNITNHEIKQPVKFVMQKNIYEPYGISMKSMKRQSLLMNRFVKARSLDF